MNNVSDANCDKKMQGYEKFAALGSKYDQNRGEENYICRADWSVADLNDSTTHPKFHVKPA